MLIHFDTIQQLYTYMFRFTRSVVAVVPASYLHCLPPREMIADFLQILLMDTVGHVHRQMRSRFAIHLPSPVYKYNRQCMD